MKPCASRTLCVCLVLANLDLAAGAKLVSRPEAGEVPKDLAALEDAVLELARKEQTPETAPKVANIRNLLENTVLPDITAAHAEAQIELDSLSAGFESCLGPSGTAGLSQEHRQCRGSEADTKTKMDKLCNVADSLAASGSSYALSEEARRSCSAGRDKHDAQRQRCNDIQRRLDDTSCQTWVFGQCETRSSCWENARHDYLDGNSTIAEGEFRRKSQWELMERTTCILDAFGKPNIEDEIQSCRHKSHDLHHLDLNYAYFVSSPPRLPEEPPACPAQGLRPGTIEYELQEYGALPANAPAAPCEASCCSTCSFFDCSSGGRTPSLKLKSSATSIQGNGQEACCLGTCEGFFCSDGWTPKILPPATCAGLSCELMECCEGAALQFIQLASAEDPITPIVPISTCPDGNYMSGTSCLPCTQDECANCSSANSCDLCKEDQLLFHGLCVASCPGGYWEAGGICTNSCSATACDTCSSATVCTSCKDSKYLLNGACEDSCPEGYYDVEPDSVLGTGGKCMKCSYHCEACTGATGCTKCEAPTVISEGVCDTGCESDSYIDGSGACQKCPASCSTCTSSQCTSCTSSLYLTADGACVSNCPAGFFKGGSRICESCGAECIKCSDALECEACGNGYFLGADDHECHRTCPSGYYGMGVAAGNTGGTCAPCSKNCATCAGPDLCAVCANGTYSYKGACAQTCPTGLYGSGSACQACSVDCLGCDAYDHCTACSNNLLLHNGACVERCPNGTYAIAPRADGAEGKCEVCSSSCLACDASKCTECGDGTYLLDGQCANCSEHCKSCDGSTCLECDGFSQLYEGSCYMVSSAECTDGSYAAIENNKVICQYCPSHCKTCTSPQECTSCNDTHVLIDGDCRGDCVSGSYPGSFGACNACPGKCTSCTSATNCTACASGHYLLEGDCMAGECPEGYYGHMEFTGGICLSCGSCSRCDESTCFECKDSTFLLEGNCTAECPKGKSGYGGPVGGVCYDCLDSNCDKCISANECTVCNDQTYLSEGDCVIECPEATFPVYDEEGAWCQKCGTGCANCDNATTCNRCEGTSSIEYLFQGQCLLQCPAGFYGDSEKAGGDCMPCIDNCIECCNGVECLKCTNGTYLDNITKTCVSECPGNHFSFGGPTGGECRMCHDECVSCSSENGCTECNGDLYLHEGSCTETCPDGYYESVEITQGNGNCVSCNSSMPFCKTCDGPSSCTSCYESHFLREGQEGCFDTCPEGSFDIKQKDRTIGCQNCMEHCHECATHDTCKVCGGYTYLLNGTCRNHCPEGYSAAGVHEHGRLCVRFCTDERKNNLCLNGGQVRGIYPSCTCDCTEDYVGDYCEIPAPCTQGPGKQPCEHGTPIGTGGNCNCSCHHGWYGPFCSYEFKTYANQVYYNFDAPRTHPKYAFQWHGFRFVADAGGVPIEPYTYYGKIPIAAVQECGHVWNCAGVVCADHKHFLEGGDNYPIGKVPQNCRDRCEAGKGHVCVLSYIWSEVFQHRNSSVGYESAPGFTFYKKQVPVHLINVKLQQLR
eukprot:gb/GFBE01023163.1/.p1 GENE.gb/GFBE01023163.1/~~gb/GFBE01023163.1/.p1  ORF type:complete len:1520 (+),score=233.79 gb/GFBE01023163.1/:1-4560(+)